jgi:hypothetical protein
MVSSKKRTSCRFWEKFEMEKCLDCLERHPAKVSGMVLGIGMTMVILILAIFGPV